jgi:hypothetical protein
MMMIIIIVVIIVIIIIIIIIIIAIIDARRIRYTARTLLLQSMRIVCMHLCDKSGLCPHCMLANDKILHQCGGPSRQ